MNLKRFVRGMFKKLPRHLVRWYADLKHWHAVCYVGTFIAT